MMDRPKTVRAAWEDFAEDPGPGVENYAARAVFLAGIVHGASLADEIGFGAVLKEAIDLEAQRAEESGKEA